MTDTGHPSLSPPGDEVVVTEPEGRLVARVLRWVRVATMGMLVVLAGTAWRDAWPVPGGDVVAATLPLVGVLVVVEAAVRLPRRTASPRRGCTSPSAW